MMAATAAGAGVYLGLVVVKAVVGCEAGEGWMAGEREEGAAATVISASVEGAEAGDVGAVPAPRAARRQRLGTVACCRH